MIASRCCLSVALLGASLAVTAPARAGAEGETRSAVDAPTELTWLLGSGDLLGPGGARSPDEAPPWETLAARGVGEGSRLRFSVHDEAAGFLPFVTTRATLRLEWAMDSGGQAATSLPRDLSSSLGASFRLPGGARLGFDAFPFDSDYVRLGWLHALDWAGTDVAHRESVFVSQRGGVPSFVLGYEASFLRLFCALKAAVVADAVSGERRLWGALWGARVEAWRALRFEAGLGYFQRAAPAGATAEPFLEGASLRAVLHRGASEPELAAEPFRTASLREAPLHFEAARESGWAIALEAVSLVTRVRRGSDDDPRLQKLEAAPAAGIYGSLRGGRWAGHAATTLRSFAFVTRDDPRLIATITPRARALPELTAWLGASLDVRPGITCGLELGMRSPAGLETASEIEGYGRTLVAGGPAGLQALPAGAGRLPLGVAQLSWRWALSGSVMLALSGQYLRNPNRVRPVAAGAAVGTGFAPPDSLWVFGAAQARF